MAGGGLLAKVLRSPELMLALGLGGAGAMSADEDQDPLVRALGGAAGGAALGLGVRGGGRALKGLLGRVPVQMPTQQDKIAQAMAMRRAMGLKGSQVSQFPSGQAMSEADKYAEMLAMEKYGDKIGQSGVDRVIEGVDEVGRLGSKLFDTVGGAGSKVWDGVDAIAHRAAPIDRFADLAKYSIPLGAAGALGAGGYTIYEMLVGSKDREADEATRAKVLGSLGVDPTPTGLMMFQAQNGIEPTGQWDEQTIVAVAKAVESKQRESQSEGPPPPSLAPHNQR